VSLAIGDLEAARRDVDLLQRLDPASPAGMSLRSFVLEREGRGAEALDVQRRTTALRPSWWNLLNLAKIERGQGNVQRARECLAQAVERAPANVLVKAELAGVEMYWGDPERALDLFLQVVGVSPQPQYLSDLGAIQLLLGRARDALPVLERAVAAGSRTPSTLLNLADCHSLLGEGDAARHLYQEAVTTLEQRGSDISAKELGVKAQCLAQLGRGPEARATLALALGRSDSSGELWLDAALVEAVLGDLSAAEQWSRKALAAGLSPRYFDLPWFAAVRPRLALQAVQSSAG
jgi:eukaryotic-like serine/threonine-protein kinase